MLDVYCSKCDLDFEVKTYDNGECPNCHREFYWYEECTSDYSDCWDCFEFIDNSNTRFSDYLRRKRDKCCDSESCRCKKL